jgi:peptide-methionine (R)-S-oxide reductase
MTHSVSRRNLFASGAAIALLAACSLARKEKPKPGEDAFAGSEWRALSKADWKARLSPEAFAVLREEDTERPFTSPLNEEKRAGTFHCAGCGFALFSSDTKYDSGTGWPSFWDALPGALGTKSDYLLAYERTEYHCARCLGHQGHVFDDGPAPTGLRYCNNGVALTFKAG